RTVPPTEPFGAPANSGAAGTDYSNNCGTLVTEYNGIVPFRALGLVEDDVRDAYGNLITYQVTPELAGMDPSGYVGQAHEYCRTPIWIVGGVNSNPEKAAFCCVPGVEADGTMTV